MSAPVALIVGAGRGLSAALGRRCAADGMKVGLAARDAEKLGEFAGMIGAKAYRCDAAQPEDVAALFERVARDFGPPGLVVYNAGHRVPGAIAELDPAAVREALLVSCYGGFLVGQQAARLMLAAGSGSIFFTGASASVKGYAKSAPFAMGKFGLRGLAQSMARELAPRNIHVAHFVLDGAIAGPNLPVDPEKPDRWLDPDAIAATYLGVHYQDRSAWTWEVELRPWLENF